jgi:hypothetical protein
VLLSVAAQKKRCNLLLEAKKDLLLESKEDLCLKHNKKDLLLKAQIFCLKHRSFA